MKKIKGKRIGAILIMLVVYVSAAFSTASHEVTLATVSSLETTYSEVDGMEQLFEYKSFKLGTTTIPYREASICPDNTKLPCLVLYLHGGSARGNDNQAQLKEAALGEIVQYLETHHLTATVIVPQCPSGSGWTGQLRKVVNELLKSHVTQGIADENRIYVLGGSMGGTGTWCQLSRFPDFYAAGMPVAGNPSGQDAAQVAKTPVYTVMGTADNIMSMDTVEEFLTEVEEQGGIYRYDVEQGWTHQNVCEQSYTEARLGWLFSHRKGEMCIKGDVNGDGFVNITDVLYVVNHITGNEVTPFIKSNADINDDDTINITDVMYIVNIILGK